MMAGSLYRAIRRRLGLGSPRGDLIVSLARAKRRADRAEEARNEAHQRVKAEKAVRHAAVNRATHLEAQVRRLRAQLAQFEPGRVEGCVKVRFHRQAEADEFMAQLAEETGEPVEAYNVYGCKTCPRSPLTHRRYLHVGHPARQDAQHSKATGKARRVASRAEARRGGLLVEQRLDPDTAAKLRALTETA